MEDEELSLKFKKLVDEWQKETSFYSSISAITKNPAYQEIIEMGDKVVPLIIEELRNGPVHLYTALHRITGEDPVAEKDIGYVTKMNDAWIDWYDNK